MTMKNGDTPAIPIEFNGFGQYAPEAHYGLTKREMIAMHAMQAITSNPDLLNSLCELSKKSGRELMELVSTSAVAQADALLKELEK